MIVECRNCPYVKKDFERKMRHYSNTVQKNDIPNNIYGYLKPEDASDEFERFLWCDKVGGKVGYFGYCEDAHSNLNYKKCSSKRRKTTKYDRYLKHYNHLKDLHKINKYSCMTPVIYTDKLYIRGQGYIASHKPYFKRIYRSNNGKSGRSRFYKKISNKKIRRYKGEIPNGRWCYKLYDYWYEMW